MESHLDEHAVFLITGPSASGKSTVARLLARQFERGVHVEGDIFRRSIVSGKQEMDPEPSPEALEQLTLRYRLGAATADVYFAAGFTVVLEDVIAGRLLSEYTELIRSRPLRVVVLVPSIEAVSARDASREASGYTRWSIPELHDAFVNETPRTGLWLDSSRQTAEETVEEILARTING